MPLKNNPACNCCEVVDSCCETIEIHPLPTRTDNGGVITYDDTLWDSNYVTGVSGTDNTIPANTTVTIRVPIGCTDYAVDVEVLDDSGFDVGTNGTGLVIKVGDCLQASNDMRQVNVQDIYGPSATYDVIQWPTIWSQHEVDTFERDNWGTNYDPQRPFYGDEYAAYRFYEIFDHATMVAKVQSYRAPPYRSDTSTDKGESVQSSRFPHDAGGLTVQITIQTGDYPVEIGMVKVYAGHINCDPIQSLEDRPQELCREGGYFDSLYTIRDPASQIENNGITNLSYTKTGTVGKTFACNINFNCDYEYSVRTDFTQFTGQHSWLLKFTDITPYFPLGGGTTVDATADQLAAVDTYLQKCGQHNWTHADTLVDWRLYEWNEPSLGTSGYAITTSLSVTGGCNINAPSAEDETTEAENFWTNCVFPSQGPMWFRDITQCSSSCVNDMLYCGNPVEYRSWTIGRNPCNSSPRTLPLIATKYLIEGRYNLSGSSFKWPIASQTAIPSRHWDFTYTANTVVGTGAGGADCCAFDQTVYTGFDIDADEDSVITKIPFYTYSDNSTDFPDYEYKIIGGEYIERLPTRDKHLQNLSLYVASESATFEAKTGLTMNYAALNSSTYRPDYATCGCECTADELYLDDLINCPASPVAVHYHRWMEFSDGSETWYLLYSDSTTWPYNTIDLFFRRKSDCLEIQFTGISNTNTPSSTGSVTKTGTNSDGDTVSLDVYA